MKREAFIYGIILVVCLLLALLIAPYVPAPEWQIAVTPAGF